LTQYEDNKYKKLVKKFHYPDREETEEWKRSLVLNKTSTVIPDNVLETIQNGLDFNGPNQWNALDIIPDIDRICNKLNDTESKIIKINLANKIEKYITKRNGKTTIEDKNYYKYKNNIEELHNFLKNNRLEIIKADKSKQIIIVEQEWVKKKKQELVDSDKFRELPIDPIEVIYKELKNRITKLYKLKSLTKDEKEFILSENNDRTPKMKIQLKTHKADESVRPIVDFRNTTLYNLEKILKQKLKIYQNSEFAIYNTDELLCDIKQIDIKDTYRIASLDIIDMYPSIIWEIIEPKLTQLKIEPEIIDLIEFTYRSNYFEINSKYYTQNSGISMGSVIGPKLAEIIMIDIDKEISDIYGIKFYRRYVDDVLIIYDEEAIPVLGAYTIRHNSDVFLEASWWSIESDCKGLLTIGVPVQQYLPPDEPCFNVPVHEDDDEEKQEEDDRSTSGSITFVIDS
ncbi:uncharacterized protein LOC111615875, partial [Centruroides sculpturatus]|uniref:uncharacterized protein LOC111615875 n=1 Tax=Centruroides sculpturatus TaxID=218467 RepID=UPI000C6E4610